MLGKLFCSVFLISVLLLSSCASLRYMDGENLALECKTSQDAYNGYLKLKDKEPLEHSLAYLERACDIAVTTPLTDKIGDEVLKKNIFFIQEYLKQYKKVVDAAGMYGRIDNRGKYDTKFDRSKYKKTCEKQLSLIQKELKEREEYAAQSKDPAFLYPMAKKLGEPVVILNDLKSGIDHKFLYPRNGETREGRFGNFWLDKKEFTGYCEELKTKDVISDFVSPKKNVYYVCDRSQITEAQKQQYQGSKELDKNCSRLILLGYDSQDWITSQKRVNALVTELRKSMPGAKETVSEKVLFEYDCKGIFKEKKIVKNYRFTSGKRVVRVGYTYYTLDWNREIAGKMTIQQRQQLYMAHWAELKFDDGAEVEFLMAPAVVAGQKMIASTLKIDTSEKSATEVGSLDAVDEDTFIKSLGRDGETINFDDALQIGIKGVRLQLTMAYRFAGREPESNKAWLKTDGFPQMIQEGVIAFPSTDMRKTVDFFIQVFDEKYVDYFANKK